MSRILYLFYNADLQEICKTPDTRTSGLDFVDDVKILAYGPRNEENCRTPKLLHAEYKRWAIKYGAVFTKYVPIHFALKPKKFNTTATVNVVSSTLKPRPDMRIFGVQLDTRLKWHAHVREVENKMTKHTLALAKITNCTWSADFARARYVYPMVSLAMTYGSAVWHIAAELSPTQVGRK